MEILLVDDDALLIEGLVKVLESNGYKVDAAGDAQAAMELATMVEYDLILLALQTPQIDGVQVCQSLRSRGYRKPILLLTDTNSDEAVMQGLDAGADEYVSKVSMPATLLSSMRSWLKRSRALSFATAPRAERSLSWGNLHLEPEAGRVRIGDRRIDLSITEYKLLELFLKNPNRIFSCSDLLEPLWSAACASENSTFTACVTDLNEKLKACGLKEEIIETVCGMGYGLRTCPQRPNPAGGSERANPTNTLQPDAEAQSEVAQVFRRFRDSFRDRAVVLERAKLALLAGDLSPDLGQDLRQEVHKLSGSLATFGYPEGSRLARSIEHLLMQEERLQPQDEAQLAELLNALQRELEAEPIDFLSDAPGSQLDSTVADNECC